MADSEFYSYGKVMKDEWFRDVTFEAAGFNTQENVILENMETDGNLKKGFFGADIFVTEGKRSGKCSLGTCFLLQNPATWGEEDKSMRRFVITAAHCVASANFGKPRKFDELRLRVPISPWEGFPKDVKNYKAGWANTQHLFDEIVVRKENIFIHEKYNGHWNCGYDLALVAIPEMSPSQNATMLFFDTCELDNFPDSVVVNGFPAMSDKRGKWHTHLPYFSARTREENDDEWQLTIRRPVKKAKARMVDYPLATQPGISGGVLIVDQIVVGIHNAKKSQGAGHGTVFTNELQNWMKEIYEKWDPDLGQYLPSKKVIQKQVSEDRNEENKEDKRKVENSSENQEMQKLRKEMERQKAEMERQKVEMERQKAELERQRQTWQQERQGLIAKMESSLESEKKDVKNDQQFNGGGKALQKPEVLLPKQSEEAVHAGKSNSERPTIGDRFQVQGADYWKTLNNINGTIVYKGEVNTIANSYVKDNVEVGTLVFVREKNSYTIKADETHIYKCDGQLDGAWRSYWWYSDYLQYGRWDYQKNMRVTKIDNF